MITLPDLYSKGVKIWIPDQNSVWIGATVLQYIERKNLIQIIDDNGKTSDFKLNTKSEHCIVFLRNPDILIGQNDLTYLSYLNEPEVLYNLQVRFCDRREIYTYCGIILVAINPYQELSIYGNMIINAYHLQNSNDLDPHIFAVAENAFRRMSSFDENQSIIVSGESGAGKTVSAKYTMRYFALVGGAKANQASYNLNVTQIEKKVLLSNPILEAMGNAKTIRNDNSSRFGKYLKIMFNNRNQIIGANMSTYLLEKSRVVFQNIGERNYHIFYQIVNHSQSEDETLINCGLVKNSENYHYLRYGETTEIDGIDDSQEFLVTKESFLKLGISLNHIKEICEILAAILHLGNIKFRSDDATDSSIIENPELLSLVCELLKCSVDQMKIWLCFRSIVTLQETLHKPLSKNEAQYFRDALVKTIYSNLFDWVVKHANKSLSTYVNRTEKKNKSSSANETHSNKFIGILDIYGFETFEQNSFEQFCINFANENLQLQFNLHVFKLEQEEYMKEGLEWTFIDYYNNQPCIDLIESKLGILDLLDEECKMPQGSDENWCRKIYSQHLNKSKLFSKSKLSNLSFIIKHFAGHVQYECSGFIEKNRDSILEEQVNLLKASDAPLVAEMFLDEDSSFSKMNDTELKVSMKSPHKSLQLKKQENIRKMKKTVGSQFKTSLKMLMETLNKTNPHYIRCIKPNDLKLPFTFCPARAVQQLRACGVLETIRLSAAGFPSRWTYIDFYQRYYILLPHHTVKNLQSKQASQLIVEVIIKNVDAFRFGKNKLFFRAGQVAYLEKLRSEKIENSVVLIQSKLRGSIQRKTYLSIQKLVLQIQTLVRRKLAMNKVSDLRRNRASLKIQSFYRMYLARKCFMNQKKSVITIENWWRKIIIIKLKEEYKKLNYIILCQSVIRAFTERKKFLKIKNGIIQIQNHYRRRKAKLILKQLKIEARSLSHIKFVNKGLENKIIELTQRLDNKEKEIGALFNKMMKEKQIELKILKQDQSEACRNYQLIIQELQTDIIKLKRNLNQEILEKDRIISEKELMEIDYAKKVQCLQQYIDDLKSSAENNKPEPNINTLTNVSDEEVNQKLIKEQIDHQHLIRDYEKLEIKYENLYNEYVFIKSSMAHKSFKDPTNIFETKSNFSRSDSSSCKDDADIESLSDDEPSKKKKQFSDISENQQINDVGTVGDLAIVMQLQMRLNSVYEENHRFKETNLELEHQLLKFRYSMENQTDMSSKNGYDKELYELIKEIKITDDHNFKTKLIDKIVNLKTQLLQQKQEYQKFRINMFSGNLGKLADALESKHILMRNDDEEFHLVIESQKEANRKMLKEIDELKSQDISYRKALLQLKKEKEQLQIQIAKLGDLIGNFKITPQERLDKFVQNEISRILMDNLRLQKRNDQNSAELIQLKRGLKYFAFRLQHYEGALVPNPDKEEELLQLIQNDIYNTKLKSDNSQICYSRVGLIDLTMAELMSFIKTFIVDLSPSSCVKYTPYHFVSYTIFLITRKFDVFKEEEKLKTFLTKVISALKSSIKKRKDYIEYLTMWMSNVFCLLNMFQQYSGVEPFRNLNNSEENTFNFTEYDMSEFIRLLKELCINIFQMVMDFIFENYLPQSLCIDAILLHEDIKTLTNKDGKMYKHDLENQRKNTSFNILQKHLQSILDILKLHRIPSELINQIFVRIVYLINAHCLNTLLFKTDLCYFTKGVQIRYNLSSFETWLRHQNLEYCVVSDCLKPITEAVQLLQILLKTKDDAVLVCDMCKYLKTSQVVKILHNFNPQDGYGCRLPSDLITHIETLMKSRVNYNLNDDILETSTTTRSPVDLPFIHNSQAVNKIIIPKQFYLPCLNILTEKDLVE